jgi:hypothetical protein
MKPGVVVVGFSPYKIVLSFFVLLVVAIVIAKSH